MIFEYIIFCTKIIKYDDKRVIYIARTEVDTEEEED